MEEAANIARVSIEEARRAMSTSMQHELHGWGFLLAEPYSFLPTPQ